MSLSRQISDRTLSLKLERTPKGCQIADDWFEKRAAASTLPALFGAGLLVFVGFIGAFGQTNPVQVVPLPVKALVAEGTPFQITSSTLLVSGNGPAATKEVAARAADAFRGVTGMPFKSDPTASAKGNIVLRLEVGLFANLPDWQRAEGYRLAADSSGVVLSACTAHGLFNGVQTLAQLVTPAGPGRWQLAACTIEDYPRFQWRGLLLDPARHFLPPDYLKKFIEVMACYKYNRLQLHLTDDQGWRIEIKKDPRLTEIGSVRKQSPKRGDRHHGDGQVYGPFFYTQEQIRDLVAFARARFVTLVPEIEIPGHFGAAIASYPEFSCAGKSSEVHPAWGINADILCPGNDAAVAFVKGVLGEVCDLFPSRFIHIGGDEVPRDRWKSCSNCQARMKAEGLKTEAQLQTWLNHRLEEFLTSRGRRMIGWDEILDGGLTPDAVVMSWRGSQGGIAAAKANHDVIMSPSTHCYFDYAQAKGSNEPECIGGFISLHKVYSFDPEPAELSAPQRRHILGAQGNIWGEYIWDGKDVEYFAFPRALALAEVIWSPIEGRSFDSFLSRLDGQYAYLDRRQVNYRKPDAETARRESEVKAETK
jgi:hexosaminidase